MTAEEFLRLQKINNGEWCICDGESGGMMTKKLNCMNCCVGNFKSDLCDCEDEFYKEFKCVGSRIDFTKMVMDRIRPTGHWIEDEEQNHVEVCYHCSECGFEAWGKHERTNYCGGCGAYMKGEIDDA